VEIHSVFAGFLGRLRERDAVSVEGDPSKWTYQYPVITCASLLRARLGSIDDATNKPALVPSMQKRRGSEKNRTVNIKRCTWADGDPLLVAYHDEEWGVPEFNGRALWESLMLSGFQAGLSWITILRKRKAFREAFRGFDPKVVARFSEKDVTRLLGDPTIIRSRAKITATVIGAQSYLNLAESGRDFSTLVWSMVGNAPIQNPGGTPTRSPQSEEMAKVLKSLGFKFVGPVIVYAWMQSSGMVNDHLQDCFRRNAGSAPKASARVHGASTKKRSRSTDLASLARLPEHKHPRR
jgi:DNA-3-methyladenine glycosylase I